MAVPRSWGRADPSVLEETPVAQQSERGRGGRKGTGKVTRGFVGS